MLESDFSLDGVKSVLTLLNSRRQANLFLNSGETKIFSVAHVENEVLMQLQAATVAVDNRRRDVDAAIVSVSKIASMLDVPAAIVDQVMSAMVNHEAHEVITVVTDAGEKLALDSAILGLLRERVAQAVRAAPSGRVKLAALCSVVADGIDATGDAATALMRMLPLHFTVHSLLAPLLPAITARCCVRVEGRFTNIFTLSPPELAALGMVAVEVCSDRACAMALCEGCFATYKQFCSYAARPDVGDAEAVVPPLELTAAALDGLREEAAALVPDASTLRGLLQLPGEGASAVVTNVGLAKILIAFEHIMSPEGRNPAYANMVGCELAGRVLLHSSFLSARRRAVYALCRQTEGCLVVLDAQGPSTADFLDKWWFRQNGSSSPLQQFGKVARARASGVSSECLLLGGGRFLMRSSVLAEARNKLAAWLRAVEAGDACEPEAWWLDFGAACGPVGGSMDALAAAFNHILDVMPQPGSPEPLREVLGRVAGSVCVVVEAGAPVLLRRTQLDSVVERAILYVYTYHPQMVSADGKCAGLSPRLVTEVVAAATSRVVASRDGEKDVPPPEALCAAVGPLLQGALLAARESYSRQWGQPQALLHPLGPHTRDKFPALWRFAASQHAYTVVGAAGADGGRVAGAQLALETERDGCCLDVWNRILSLVCSASGSGSVPVSWLLPSSTVPGADIYDVVDRGSSGDRALLQLLVLEQECVPFVFILTAYTCALNGIHCGALFRQQGHLGSLLSDYYSVCRHRPASSLRTGAASAVAAAWVAMQVAVWEDENTSIILNAEPLFSVLATMWLLVLPTEVKSAIEQNLAAQLAAEGAGGVDPSALLATRAAVAAVTQAPSLWGFLDHVHRSVVPQVGLGILRQPVTFDRLKKRERLALLHRDHLAPAVARCSLDAARACCLAAGAASGDCSGDAAVCRCAAVLFACNMFVDATEHMTSLVVCALAVASGARRPRLALVSAECSGPLLGASGLLEEEREGSPSAASSAGALASLRELHRCLRELVVPARLMALRCLETRAGGSDGELLKILQLGDASRPTLPPGGEDVRPEAAGTSAGVYTALASLIQFVQAADSKIDDAGSDTKVSKRRSQIKSTGKVTV